VDTTIGLIKFDPQFGDIAVWSQAKPGYDPLDLRSMAEPRLKCVSGAFYCLIIKPHLF
jgi:hypothetical protein